MAKNPIPEINVESPFGFSGFEIHCPICGACVAPKDEEIIPCEHLLAAFSDGDLVACNEIGYEIWEEGKHPELFDLEGEDEEECLSYDRMISTGSNFILSNTMGGMACGPVWNQLSLVFEAYPEKIMKKDEV